MAEPPTSPVNDGNIVRLFVRAGEHHTRSGSSGSGPAGSTSISECPRASRMDRQPSRATISNTVTVSEPEVSSS